MSYDNERWKPFTWHCPNCGKPVTGYKDDDERIKVSCSTCRSVMVRTLKGRRHDTIELYAPKGQIRLNG